MVQTAGASITCQKEGDLNLFAKPLQSCTQSGDGSTTGWARTGSCNWDPSDSGYHEVCVTMSEEFLQASARHDANDLSSVVQPGGHWCICAWAWASAVQRDPEHFEGISLECTRTNQRLREVYQSFISAGADLTSPSGAAYKAKEALDAVNKFCPIAAGNHGASSTSSSGAASAASAVTASMPASGSFSMGLALLLAVVLLYRLFLSRLTRSGTEVAPLTKIESGADVKTSTVERVGLGCYDSCGEENEFSTTPLTRSALR